MAKKKTEEQKKPSWFRRGEEGAEAYKRQEEIAKARKEKSAPRFWLRAGEEAKIVFVDDEGFYIKEHNLKLDGRWGNFVTCVRDFQPCPICNAGHKPTYTAYYTVIDTREFVRKDGTKVKNRRVLFPAKRAVISMLADFKKKYKSLVGLAFSVKRYTDEDVNCGNYFELASKKRVDLKKFGEEGNPFDYEKILAPPTADELDAYGFGDSVIGAEEEEINEEELSDILD